ncbi:MAG: hypothetical protein KDB01_12235 [Planctomycetaceae bacterium]|nr:hypothetical protein [Planctomycetaceae bacterium]
MVFNMSQNQENPYSPPGEGPKHMLNLPHAVSALERFPGVGPNGVVSYSVAGDPMYHNWSKRHWVNFYDAFLIPDIVAAPLKIWRDLNRAGAEGLYCVAGIPTLQFATNHKLDNLITLPEGQIFLAFASADFVVSKWRWEDVDSDGSGLPSSHNVRFGNEIWPHSAT